MWVCYAYSSAISEEMGPSCCPATQTPDRIQQVNPPYGFCNIRNSKDLGYQIGLLDPPKNPGICEFHMIGAIGESGDIWVCSRKVMGGSHSGFDANNFRELLLATLRKKSRVAFWVPMTKSFVHWGPKGGNPYLLKTPLWTLDQFKYLSGTRCTVD